MRPTSSCTVGMIEAHDGEAVKRQVVDQGPECVLDGVEGLEVVEVLGIDVGDHRDIGGKLEEVPSLSSASTTIQSPAPSRALVP